MKLIAIGSPVLGRARGGGAEGSLVLVVLNTTRERAPMAIGDVLGTLDVTCAEPQTRE